MANVELKKIIENMNSQIESIKGQIVETEKVNAEWDSKIATNNGIEKEM